MKNIVRVSTIATVFFAATIIPNGMHLFTVGIVLYMFFATVNLKKTPVQEQPTEEVRLSHH